MQIPDHVLVVNRRGTFEKDDIDRLDEQIREKLARYERIGIVGNLEELAGVASGAARVKDAAAQPSYLGDWRRFPRVAVLASGDFVKLAVEAIGKSLPQVQLRAFGPDEFDQAVEFAAALDPGDSRAAATEVSHGAIAGVEDVTEDSCQI